MTSFWQQQNKINRLRTPRSPLVASCRRRRAPALARGRSRAPRSGQETPRKAPSDVRTRRGATPEREPPTAVRKEETGHTCWKRRENARSADSAPLPARGRRASVRAAGVSLASGSYTSAPQTPEPPGRPWAGARGQATTRVPRGWGRLFHCCGATTCVTGSWWTDNESPSSVAMAWCGSSARKSL